MLVRRKERLLLILRLWWGGEVWQGRIGDETVFGKGFGEVTVERV
jgi:hypothetical protein